jgi:DNA adenine methylase
VINDAGRDVFTFFRVLQRHYLPFVEMMRFQLTMRAEFERLVATDPDTLTDLERSARFYYLQRNSFGGKVRGRTFGVAVGDPGRFDITKLVPELEALHARLAGVRIEALPFSAFIARYDRPTTLFYLDPPYYGCEDDYGRELFAREDFARLATQLAGISGRFLLSLNDTPEVRRIFSAFAIEAVRTTYSVGGAGKAKSVGEVIISPAR